MGSVTDGVASEYDMPKMPNNLPLTDCNIRMPNIIPNTEEFIQKNCDYCGKEDVCMYRDECRKAIKDILDIERRTNALITTNIQCNKWTKRIYQINSDGALYK